MTRTAAELSIVCDVPGPPGVRRSGPWRALEVLGPLDHGAVGILRDIAEPLAAAGISLFAISTFDTDYVLVPADRVAAAAAALRRAGHALETDAS